MSGERDAIKRPSLFCITWFILLRRMKWWLKVLSDSPRLLVAKALISGFASLLGGCSEPDSIEIHAGEAMGTSYRIKTVGRSEFAMGRIHDMLARFDRDLSTWRGDSWVARFNEAPAVAEMEMPQSVVELLEISRRLHEETAGCFDPTIGALIRVWGFGAWKHEWKGEPANAEIEAARAASGFKNLRIHGTQIAKLHDGLMLDFSAIAKGHAVDQMGTILREAGIENFIIEFGGDILASGNAPGKSGWIIAGTSLEKPIVLQNQAIATSGSDFNSRKHDSHILDPRSGRPVPPGPAVFATAPTCAEADALATAQFILNGEVNCR